jgi:hypothetical protein
LNCFALPAPSLLEPPADVYFRRDTAIRERRAKIKKLTIQSRRFLHHQQAA